MKLDLTFYVVLVFFVPGVALVGALALGSSEFSLELLHFYHDPQPLLGMVLLACIFGLGAIVDSARSLIVDPALSVSDTVAELDEEDNTSYVRMVTSENLEVLSYLLERSFEYYRFNANSALSFSIILVTCLVRRGSDSVFAAAFILTAMFWLAAKKSRRDSAWILNEFVQGAKEHVSRPAVHRAQGADVEGAPI